jgi:hypothetical protein
MMKCQLYRAGSPCQSEKGTKQYWVIGSLGRVPLAMCERCLKKMSKSRRKSVTSIVPGVDTTNQPTNSIQPKRER